MAATIKDVARLAGVSRSTVSRVLNAKSEVDPETATRVWQAVKELDYHPNTSARALVRQRTDTIGVMVADVTNPFYEKIIKGIEATANAAGLNLAFYNSYEDLAGRRKIILSALEGSRVDGLIVVGSHLGDKSTLLEMAARGLAISLVERNFADPSIPCVVSDNKTGARLAVEHLLGLGHRRIAFITGNLHYQTAIERLEGYKETLSSHGIPIEDELIAFGDFEHKSGYEAMKQLLALPQRPTAVFASNDMMAIGAMQAIGEAGLSVPGDVAVVGYDDITFASMVYPQLTTIRQPLYEMGALAAQGLIERLRNGHDTEPFKKFLPVELVIRKSCGAS
ncbi:MAG: LacI family transcriptional regulator [Firmicutes bacterium]|nr:LacI family transcriptional regulator [Bacillota bacterium]